MKTEKVVIQVFTSIEDVSDVNYHAEFLAKLELLIVKTLSGSRKSLRIRAGQFWNRTFGKKSDLPYSDELKPVLMKYQAKLNLLLPVLKGEAVIMDIPLSMMDDTAQFPEYSQNTQQNTASPKLKTKQVTAPSPVKIHGSFLGKKSPKKLGSPKAVLGNFLASGTTKSSPKSPFRNSPVKNVRRKLPINNQDDDSDFVVIKDSPATKKKRLLTEHQKEMMRTRRELPAMYNALDNSQDTTLMRSLSQDHTQLTQDSTFRLIEKPEIMPVEIDKQPKVEQQPTTETDKVEQPVITEGVEIDEKHSNNKVVTKNDELNVEVVSEQQEKVLAEEDKDIILSSQTQESQQSQTSKRRKSILKSNTRDSSLLLSGLDNIIPAAAADRNSSNETEMNLSEDIELFDTETSNKTDDAQQLIVDKPHEPANEPAENTKESSSSPEHPEMNMEAQIVISKLPNKRKRSVPIAKRTDQQKKRKVSQDTTSKENQVPPPPPPRTTRRSLGSQKNRKAATDVFNFSQEEKKAESVSLPVKRRGRKSSRKSVPASFKVTNEECTGEKATSDQIEEVTVSSRPVPQIASFPASDKVSEEIQVLSSESVEADDRNNTDDGVSRISETETESISSAVPQELNEVIAENNPEQLEKLKQPVKPAPLPLMTDNVTGTLPLCSVSSPLPTGGIKLVRDPFVNYSTCSPTQTAASYIPSPAASPVTSILKKRLNDCKDSPSSPNNVSLIHEN